MLKDFTIANLLDLNETIAKDLFEGKTYPWEVLPEIGDFILKLGQTLSEEEYDHPSEDVWIAKSAKVAPTACINGPVIIGKEAEVRHCAFIRGKAIIGEGAVASMAPNFFRPVSIFSSPSFTITSFLSDFTLEQMEPAPIWDL